MSCVLDSVDTVPQDLELKRVVQHGHSLVDVAADCRGGRGVRAELHTLLSTSSGEHFSSPGLRHVGLDTVTLIAGSQRLDHQADDSVLLVLVPLCWLAATQSATLSVSFA